jgi:hypothetical protein
MSRLGQFDDLLSADSFYDVGDFSTDIFDLSAVDFDYSALSGDTLGLDEGLLYDIPTTETIGYDVADPLYGEPYMDAVYDPALTLADDYGDLYAPPTYEQPAFDPATGVAIGTDAYAEDWAAWEDAGAAELEQTFGGDTDVAAGVFESEYTGIDWKAIVASGQNIFKTYQQLKQPAGATGPKPTLMRDPRTGQMVPAVRDPRTGQLVPAKRDPRTGLLVPASSLQQAGLIPGVPNTLLLTGVGLAAFFFFR